MPIRTNRGRAAVYRRLWGAPMRSPKHLAALLVVLIVLVVLGGVVLPRLFGGSDGNGAVSSAAEDVSEQPHSSSPGSGSPGRPGVTGSGRQLPTQQSVEPDEEALTVVSEWADAWVDHPDGITKKDWLAELEPYTTEEFLPQLKSVRLGNIPSSEVTGDPEPVSSRTKSLVADIPTDGPELRVTVVDTDGDWRVARYEQAG